MGDFNIVMGRDSICLKTSVNIKIITAIEEYFYIFRKKIG